MFRAGVRHRPATKGAALLGKAGYVHRPFGPFPAADLLDAAGQVRVVLSELAQNLAEYGRDRGGLEVHLSA